MKIYIFQIKWLQVFLCCTLFVGCTTQPLTDRRPDEDEYRRTANDFLIQGTKGDIEGMLALTSSILINKYSAVQVAGVFEKYEIPFLKGHKFKLNPDAMPLVERDTSYPEYEFTGSVTDGSKANLFAIFVSKEAGVYRVLGMKRVKYIITNVRI